MTAEPMPASVDFDLEMESLNEIVATYDDSPFDRSMRHWMLRSLDPFLTTGTALEFGCLYGEFTQLLAPRFSRLVVVDAAQEFLNITRKRVGAHVEFVHSLFETYETTERFDAIFLMHVLEHLIDPVAVLQKAGDLLTDSGRIYIVVPNGNAISRQIAVEMGLLNSVTDMAPADIRAKHRRIYVMDSLRRDARAAGLEIIGAGGVFLKVLANFQFDGLVGGPYISQDFMEACYRLGALYPQLCASIFLVATKGRG